MKRKQQPKKRDTGSRSGRRKRGRSQEVDSTPTHADCPCCGSNVVLTQQVVLKSWIVTGEVVPAIAQLAAGGEYFEHHCNQSRLRLYWACNACIRASRALRTDPEKQKWCDCEPYLAYFDEKRSCVDCGASFTFTKETQKHWYETLQFWVWSRPIRCEECNRKRKSGHA